MVLRVGWRTIEDSLNEPPEKSGKPGNLCDGVRNLAVKAFRDMGQTARLRLIRDRFIARHVSQGAKWVYLTWDAVKGCLIPFCSVASTYQILTAQPENYVAGKKV